MVLQPTTNQRSTGTIITLITNAKSFLEDMQLDFLKCHFCLALQPPYFRSPDFAGSVNLHDLLLLLIGSLRNLIGQAGFQSSSNNQQCINVL